MQTTIANHLIMLTSFDFIRFLQSVYLALFLSWWSVFIWCINKDQGDKFIKIILEFLNDKINCAGYLNKILYYTSSLIHLILNQLHSHSI